MAEIPEHLTPEEKEAWEKSLGSLPTWGSSGNSKPTPPQPESQQTLHLERSPLAPGPPRALDPSEGPKVMDPIPAARRVVSVMVRSGPDTGASFALDTSPLYIGRAPDNGIVVSDPATSRRHARFEQRGQDFLVVDLGSANGTLVDGVRVVEHVLAAGSVMTMGQNEFVVSVD